MQPDFFAGKNILVTGGTSGIGLQIVNGLIGKKALVSLCGRKKNILDEIRKQNPGVTALEADLSVDENIEVLAVAVPQLDGIVLNAGMIDYAPAKMISRNRLDKVFDVNFSANVLLIQKLISKKKILPGASIVFVSSIAALLGVPGTGLYAASKAALTAYAKVLASELASQKIRVNTVSPGIVDTTLIEAKNIQTEAANTELGKRYPLGFGKPGDVESMVIFLLSEDAKWITGSNIVIDGGHMLQ